MDEGFSFRGDVGRRPVLTAPSGRWVDGDVEDYVPLPVRLRSTLRCLLYQ